MPLEDELEGAALLHRAAEKIKGEIGKEIVGQDGVVELMLTAFFSQGHALLVGVPGLAKTMLVKSLAACLKLTYNRIQFTPDLMPADITGTDILEEDPATGRRVFKFMRGPVFCNLLLADEINRTPPKTQAALLQAMQEGHVTASGSHHPLAPPFTVFATQNPIEQEGTYPLPEAQLDRFMFFIDVTYPTEEDEKKIVVQQTSARKPVLNAILSPEEIIELQILAKRVPVPDHIVAFTVSLVRGTRPQEAKAPDWVRQMVRWGAGPRASQYLVAAAKVRALLKGRPVVDIEDVRSLALPILRHRIMPNFHAESEGVDASEIVRRILERTTY